MCGDENFWSLGLVFRSDAEGGVSAAFQGHAGLQGYDGILHGGIVSALLDAAMTHCLFRHGIRAVTAELKVRFHQPVPFAAPLLLSARPVALKPPVYKVAAELAEAGRVLARAEASFMRMKGDGP